MKLVIVDDDSLLCSALARGFIRLGHSSRMATSVEEALGLVTNEEPAAVLTDLDLGRGGDGVELLTRLREAGSRIPTLMMTGSDPATARARLRAAGLDEISVLEKPFEFEDLVKKLAGLVPQFQVTPAPPPAHRTPSGTMAALMGTVMERIGGRVI